jgi:hypothetical protein
MLRMLDLLPLYAKEDISICAMDYFRKQVIEIPLRLC